jgi:hypothetical protein
MLYNFVTNRTQAVDVSTLSDAEAVQLIPQHPVAQSLYTLLRAQDHSVLEALTRLLEIQLTSGGQRKFIHVRDGGRN